MPRLPGSFERNSETHLPLALPAPQRGDALPELVSTGKEAKAVKAPKPTTLQVPPPGDSSLPFSPSGSGTHGALPSASVGASVGAGAGAGAGTFVGRSRAPSGGATVVPYV